MESFLAVSILDEHFHFAFGILQDLQTALGETNALLKNLEGFIQGKIPFFQFADNGFQSRHRLFELHSAHNDTVLSPCEGTLYRAHQWIYTSGSGTTRLTVQSSSPCAKRATSSSSTSASSALRRIVPSRARMRMLYPRPKIASGLRCVNCAAIAAIRRFRASLNTSIWRSRRWTKVGMSERPRFT